MAYKESRLHRIYHNMKTRCTNPNYDKYKYYGGKGIKICPEWMSSFSAFSDWATSNGYTDEMTLERMDVNGDYSPDNCCWASRKAQANNRSTNNYIRYNHDIKTLTQWCETLGLNYDAVRQRIANGWDPERAFNEPYHDTNKKKMITFNGKTMRLCEWAKELNMSYSTLHNRFQRNWSVSDALTIPIGGHRND